MRDEHERKALEAAGFQVGDYGDFLGLTDAERRLVELRLGISRGIREVRTARGLSQRQLALMMKTSQSRVAKVEAAAPDVSLDLMLRGFFAMGGQLSFALQPSIPTSAEPASTRTTDRKPTTVSEKGELRNGKGAARGPAASKVSRRAKGAKV